MVSDASSLRKICKFTKSVRISSACALDNNNPLLCHVSVCGYEGPRLLRHFRSHIMHVYANLTTYLSLLLIMIIIFGYYIYANSK